VSQPVTLRTEVGDEHLDLAEFELRIQRGEISPQSLVRWPAVTRDAFVPAAELELYRKLLVPRRAWFSRAYSVARFPWMTASLILLNLAVYLWTAREGPLDPDAMVRFGGKVAPLVEDLGQLWRLITANFLHRDAVHIGLNMYVFFIAAGVLENTYRTLDYFWLLVVSGLATMTASLFLTDAITVGSSGMVYGCLGGVVVFGLKYRADLPPLYRKVMSNMAIPIVIGLLLIGLTSPGVDNAAHLGGLVAGVVTAPFLRPRMLSEPSRWWSPALRAFPSLATVLLVAFGDSLWGSGLPRLKVERNDGWGIVVPVPESWKSGANRLGQVAWYNGLPGLGRATFSAGAAYMPEGADVQAQASRFIDEALEPTALGRDVLKVTHAAPVAARIADRDALKVRARFEEPQSETVIEAWFVPRGDWVYQLVFTWPAEFPRYGRVVELMAQGVKFDEPKELRQARAEVLLFPNAPAGLARLGETLGALGEKGPAAEALKMAVRNEPSNAGYRVSLAVALLSVGDLDAGCEASRAAVLYAPDDPRTLEADARCELARGHRKTALERLRRALVLSPRDARLKAAEARLAAEVEN
jgi:rhomboid protease GluP